MTLQAAFWLRAESFFVSKSALTLQTRRVLGPFDAICAEIHHGPKGPPQERVENNKIATKTG